MLQVKSVQKGIALQSRTSRVLETQASLVECQKVHPKNFQKNSNFFFLTKKMEKTKIRISANLGS